jgi:NADH-quinone oxidoreductase subunit M
MTLLTILIFLPVLAAVALAFLPKSIEHLAAKAQLAIAVICLAIVSYILFGFDTSYSYLQNETDTPWLQFAIGHLGVFESRFHLGIDGLNAAMILLAAIIHFIAAVSSFEIVQKKRGYHASLLLLMGSVYGAFLAQDFFLFFIFFEFMLLPMYFLIGLWGGKNREYAALKFFIYTLVGSIFILIVLIGLWSGTGNPAATAMLANSLGSTTELTKELIYDTQTLFQQHNLDETNVVKTLDFQYLSQKYNTLRNSFLHEDNLTTIWGYTIRHWAFILLFLGFAIKLPMVPFHTWLPDAHVEAPTPISVILAGILLKVGGYGFIRIAYSVFSDVAVQFATGIAILGTFSIVWGALCALAQTDLKRLVAYSSVSHMGFVLLALGAFNTTGFNAALYQMFSHGLLSAMLFVIVGVLYSRTGDRQIGSYQGLALSMPNFTLLAAVAFFASLGLPLFSGFIGEFFSLSAAFGTSLISAWIPGIASIGIVLGAAYFLYTFRRMWLGNYWTRHQSQLPDLTLNEQLMLIILAILSLVIGVFPKYIFDLSAFTVSQLPFFK